MHRNILAVLAITVGMALGSVLPTCDKLKNVKEGVDNYNWYLVKLKDTSDYKNAEYIINLVEKQYGSNVHEPSVKSQLGLSVAGVLNGTLSQQALMLVCTDSRVEFIFPDYSQNHTEPQDSGKAEDTHNGADCFKLVLNEPYHGNNYSVIFKHRTSQNVLYYVVTKMDIAKLNDSTINFQYYYSISKGKRLTMVVGMNIKALQMVCKERKVKQIRPNYDTAAISKRNAEPIPVQTLSTRLY